MISQKERTLEVYKEAAVSTLLFKVIGGEFAESVSKLLSAEDADIIVNMLRRIEVKTVKFESQMIKDHPELKRQLYSIFTLCDFYKSNRPEESEVIALAKEKAKEICHIVAD